MTTTPATDPLLALQLKLPTHTYGAVKRFADELGDEGRMAYLLGVLAECERSEGKGREE
jgi:hypothetical protein